MQHDHRRPLALVLGAAGFIGRHTSQALARKGCEVMGIGHDNWTSQEAEDFGVTRWVGTSITLDSLLALGDLGPVNCVVHCVGSGAVSFSYADPWQDFQRATVTTAAVLEWVRRQKTPRPRLVMVSSAAVYGDQGDTDAMETSVRSPISPYGFHKLSAEMLCESSSRFFEIPISIVRLFSVYGEGLRKQLLWDACAKFKHGERRFFGTGDELRDWIHVEDAARLLAEAALQPQPSFERYNGGHVQLKTSRILSMLSGYLGAPEPEFSGEVHPGNPRRLTSDSRRATQSLGWSPTISIEDGLRAYAAWFQSAI